MGKRTSKKDEVISSLIEKHDAAIEQIEKATKELGKVERAMQKWVGKQLDPIYAQWSPRIGEVAVCVILNESNKYAYKLHVCELRGTWVRFNEGENSHAYTRFDLGNYQKYFTNDKDKSGVEFIVPALVYEQQARHWFDLPKFDDLE
jgi:hypothetical protein